ncbi:MAG: hypothetical protein M3Z04_04925 [Chloroflexota bacterium]|nr:hypothetical protein [Chloroflexota bacterium]
MSSTQATDTHEQEHHQARSAATPDAVQRTNAPLAAPSGLHLGDARLSGRGNGVVRAALAQQVQRTYGNRAAQRMLQRSAAASASQTAASPARDEMLPATVAEQSTAAETGLADAPAALAPATASPVAQATAAPLQREELAASAAPQAVQRSAERTHSLVVQRAGPDQSGDPAAPGKPDLTHDALIEQMAHVMGYADNLSAEQVALLQQHHYTAGPLIAGRNGMQMRVFFSADPRQASVVSFRGTQPSEWGDVATDFNPDGVGQDQFELNRPIIQQAMQAAARSGPAIVTGHSLGGALAQRAASEYPGLVSQVTTFQSPGINRSETAKLDAFNAQHKADGRAIDSTHYRVKGDAVPAGGEALTQGTVHTFGMNMGLLGEAESSGALGLLGLGHYALTAHGALPVTAAAMQQGHGDQLPGTDPKGLTVTDLGTQSTDEVNGETHYSETARKGVGYLGRGIGAIGRGIGAIGRGIGNGLSYAGHAIADGANYVGNAAVDGARYAGHAIADGASYVGNAAVDGARYAGHAIADGASYVGNAAVNGATAVGNGIVNGATAVGNGIVNGAGAVGNGIANGASALGSGIASGWNSLFGGSDSEEQSGGVASSAAIYGVARVQVEVAVRNGTPEETVRAQIAGMNIDPATRARLLGELAGIYQDWQVRQTAAIDNTPQ